MTVTYSVALPVVGIDICSAKEVLEAHLEKANEVGSVYFSTSNRMDPKKLTKVSNILLVNKEFTYIADLVLYQYFNKKSAPLDAAVYAPSLFADDQDYHWLKLKNIREISLDELNTFQMINKEAKKNTMVLGTMLKIQDACKCSMQKK